MPFASRKLRIFLCHASQDKPTVRKLYKWLASEQWIEPWLDKENLLAGQNFDREIRKALRDMDAIIICLSKISVTKEGYVNKEIRRILDIAKEKPEGEIYVIPLRLDDCNTSFEQLKKLHWLDYFAPKAHENLLKSLQTRAKTLKIEVPADRARSFTQTRITGSGNKNIRYRNKLAELNEKVSEQKRRLQTLKDSLSSQFQYANNIIERSIQELFDHYQSVFLSNLEVPVTPDEYEIFKNICGPVTMYVRDSIESHLRGLNIKVENDISVSVKLILPPKNIMKLYRRLAREKDKLLQKEQWVITAFRDHKTFQANKSTGKREVLEALYSIEGNTAFRDIVIGSEPRFFSNDLRSLQRQRGYKNETSDWESKYNSTLVVPMVLKRAAHAAREERRYLGFLAVDSLNPSKKRLYDSEECFHILNHAALTLSYYFLVVILYHDKKGAR